MNNPFSVVGLDISLTGTGVACCTHARTIKSSAKDAIEPRADKIWQDLWETVQEISNKSASYFVIEGLAFASKTGKVAERDFLHHFIRWNLWKLGKRFVLVPPNSLKMFATGSGNANKDEMVIAVTKNWPDYNAKNNNEADAVALYEMGQTHLLGENWFNTANFTKKQLSALDKVEW